MSTVSGEALVLLLFRPLLLGAARRGAALLLLAAGEADSKSCGRAATLRFLGGDLPMAIPLLVQHDTVISQARKDYEKINRCLPNAIRSSSSSQACTVCMKFNIACMVNAAQIQVHYICKSLTMFT